MGIKFGTDGWRGIIADDFTFENVGNVAQAIADYVLEEAGNKKIKPDLVVGYDNRFLAEKFASSIAEVLSKNGINAALGSSPAPTPAVSLAVKQKKLIAGIMVTASHNPAEYCGIKIKADYGGPATPEITSRVEGNLSGNRKPNLKETEYGRVSTEDLNPGYLKKVMSLIDMNLIKKAGLAVVCDSMYGVNGNHLSDVLEGTDCRVINIHNYRDALFGGIHPEPIEKYLTELKERVGKENTDIGVAIDGDADRIGVVDDEGVYLPPLQVFPLLLLYFVREKKLKGRVVQTISLGYLSERIAKKYKLDLQEVPVGFKNVVDWMLKPEGVIIGGEESGGYGYSGYIPERDGLLSTLYFLEMLAKTGKKLSVLKREMQEEFGASVFGRTDYRYDADRLRIDDKKKFFSGLGKKAPKEILGIKVREVKAYDGIKYILEDDSWLLIRASGTEPLLRIYSETGNKEKTDKLLETGKKIVFK